MIKRLLILALLLIAMPCWAIDDCGDADADTWCIEAGDATFDGDTGCNGTTCDGDNTIIIDAGTRNDLALRDLHGSSGNYITIRNATNGRVIIDEADANPAALTLRDSTYVEITGNGETGHTWTSGCTTDSCYGIELYSDEAVGAYMFGSIGECDYIKLQYIKVNMTDATSKTLTTGITVQSGDLSENETLDTWDIGYNYIYDCDFASFYLGNNWPGTDPRIANFDLHHNLIEDSGETAITFKGLGTNNTLSKIRNNIIRPSVSTTDRSTGQIRNVENCTGDDTPYNGCNGEGTCGEGTTSGQTCDWISFSGSGIKLDDPGGQELEIYGNRFVKTYGPSISFHEQESGLMWSQTLVYNNLILMPGTMGNTDTDYANSGIYVNASSGAYDPPRMYNNTIIDPSDYGIYGDGSGIPQGTYYWDNLIVDPEGLYIGTDDEHFDGGIGDYANTHSTTDTGFVSWDSDSNFEDGDDFDLATGHSVSVMGDEVLTTDYDGDVRVSPFDDGAYDYGVLPQTYPIQGAAGDFKYN